MRQHFLILLLLSVFTTGLIAQNNDPHIIGHVTDSKTHEHIPFVTIRVVEANIVTYTDATGHYKISSFPAGTYTLEASYVGYITKLQRITVADNVTTTVNFEIDEDALMIEIGRAHV